MNTLRLERLKARYDIEIPPSITDFGISRNIKLFLRAFLSLAFYSSSTAWYEATLGSDELTLPKFQKWIENSLQKEYGNDFGASLAKSFQPVYALCFYASRETPSASWLDMVTQSEFRLLVAYLCVYALALDAWRFVRGEYQLQAPETVLQSGIVLLEPSCSKQRESLLALPHATLQDWCRLVVETEVRLQTSLSKCLTVDAGGVAEWLAVLKKESFPASDWNQEALMADDWSYFECFQSLAEARQSLLPKRSFVLPKAWCIGMFTVFAILMACLGLSALIMMMGIPRTMDMRFVTEMEHSFYY